MDDRELMQMALDELEKAEHEYFSYQKVIKALRERLAKDMPIKIFGPDLEKILNNAGFYRKREWADISYVSQHDSPLEYGVTEALAWAVGYNQAIDKLKEQNA
jgi:hypothetical protein